MTDLFHWARYFLGPSKLVQMARAHSFSWLSNIPLCVHHTFTHSLISGHLGCFRTLAVVNNAPVNVGAQTLPSLFSVFMLTNLPNHCSKGLCVSFLIVISVFLLFKLLQTWVNRADLFGGPLMLENHQGIPLSHPDFGRAAWYPLFEPHLMLVLFIPFLYNHLNWWIGNWWYWYTKWNDSLTLIPGCFFALPPHRLPSWWLEVLSGVPA